MAKANLICIFIFFAFLSACTKKSNDTNVNFKNMVHLEYVPQAKWDGLAKKKIYFGHHSVGYNLIDGIKMHLAENPEINLNISEGTDPTLFDHAIFAHSRNGQNSNPKSKIDAFVEKMDSGLGDRIDVAGFKYCYVDFHKNTDVNEIFNYYKSELKKLSDKYPNTKFIHFTIPLTVKKTGIKEFFKSIFKIGKGTSVERNKIRKTYNELLLKEYGGNQTVFDLATYESTYPDGNRLFSKKEIYSLIPEYSSDGRHLSEVGKYNIGGQLLLFLANL